MQLKSTESWVKIYNESDHLTRLDLPRSVMFAQALE